LLKRANADWRVWASLAYYLPDLAEAAPDAFLDAVEEGLRGGRPVLLELFTDREDVLFGSSPHTALLWALERLGWSPQHLGRVARVLARLTAVDPGGRTLNRPASSLEAIFRPWLPQTAATLDQRFRVIDMLREREPEIAWRVMESMLPQFHATASPGSRPEWRDWAPEAAPSVTGGEYARTISEVIYRMLSDADTNGERWASIVRSLPMLPPEEHETVVARLVTLETGAMTERDRDAIWEELRALVGEHRSFHTAEWAMPVAHVNRLDSVRQRFEPKDPRLLYGWLFGHRPTLPEYPENESTNWEDRAAAIDAARSDAIATVAAKSGIDGVVALARSVEQIAQVGFTAGQLSSLAAEEDDLLSTHLASIDQVMATFARGFAAGRARAGGEGWVTQKLRGAAATWSPQQQAELLHLLPPTPTTWQLVASLGAPTEQQYWRSLAPFRVDEPNVEEAVRHLLEAERPNTAVELLAMCDRSRSTDPNLVMEALGRALSADRLQDQPSSHFAYAVTELLNALGRRPDIDETRVALLEWRLLPVIGRHDRVPKALHRLLARDASFFVEVVSLVYRGENEEPRELSDDDKQRAERGYSLLQSWRRVPGVEPDGSVDEVRLRAWVESARSALEASGRTAIGDQLIGQVLSGSPADGDGRWPCRAIRILIEDLASTELEHGIHLGLYNSRGVTTRDPAEGGAPERRLAERYDGLAIAVADEWPRTAAMLRRIAESYRSDSRHHDHEAAVGEDLGS
jgi:hypothetical protein